jgi:N-acetylglucosaminyl-diphospho-decaprenol L-rhamnosyltransferase
VPHVLVVIVAYNSGGDLQRAVDALERQTYADWSAIVWDNASSDGSVDTLRMGGRVQVVRCPENLGFAEANNRAAALGEGRWIACLNPDAFPEPDWLERLVACGEQTGVAAVGSVQLTDVDPAILDGLGDCYSLGGVAWRGGYLRPRATYSISLAEIFAPCAAAALYRRDAFEAAGGFDPRYFAFFEDVDLGLRLRLAGERAVLAPGAVVRHVGGGSADKVSGFAEFHGLRNLIWTFAKSMPLALWPIALPAHLVSLAVLLWIGRKRGVLAPRWRGLVAGWGGAAPFLAENVRRRRKRLGRVLPFLAFSPWSLRARRPILRPWRP